MDTLHEVRARILYTLRHQRTARFSELMKQSSLESDTFKFHVRALREQGYIQKTPEGSYTLTPVGKERANNLDNGGRQRLKQPKLSLLVVLSRKRADGCTEYLVQRRLRQPFYGYWGCISGPAQWGDDFEATAQQEAIKQCGITPVECHVHSFYRQKDYDTAGLLLEDKLFVVATASVAPGAAVLEWPYGRSEWMAFPEFISQKKVFDSSAKIVASIENKAAGAGFSSGKTTYSPSGY